jgi:hypothetical protein
MTPRMVNEDFIFSPSLIAPSQLTRQWRMVPVPSTNQDLYWPASILERFADSDGQRTSGAPNGPVDAVIDVVLLIELEP